VQMQGSSICFKGHTVTAAELFEYCRSRAAGYEGKLIVQPRLRPARALLAIMSSHGLGTVRAVTCVDRQGVRLLAASLRIPVGTVDADNFLHGASGNLVAGIDSGTGRLLQGLGSARRDWPDIMPVERHPDTGTVIEGFQLPFWAELVDLVSRGQRAFTGLRTIGWTSRSRIGGRCWSRATVPTTRTCCRSATTGASGPCCSRDGCRIAVTGGLRG